MVAQLYTVLAVSTRPPDGANYCLGPAFSARRIYRASRSIYSLGPSGLCPAEVMSFISIHQMAPATALLRACFIVVRQVSLS